MLMTGQFPQTRLRRLRQNTMLRALVRDTHLTVNDLVQPLFIHHGKNIRHPIASMPGCYQYSVDQLQPVIAEIVAAKIPAVILFGIPAYKDAKGSAASDNHGVIQAALQAIKQQAPNLLLIADVCFCEYTDHGHCGVIKNQQVDNDATLVELSKQAVSLARAGADIIAPSGMMDGMVQALRLSLDKAGFNDLPILSYAVKYSSALYGPFREAAQGAPQFGDRASYQMDPANSRDALHEAALDIQEGADLLMVKPAGAYQDIIFRLKQTFPHLPLVAYQVSGEYAMLKAASEKGWLDEKRTVLELLTGLKRSGADIIITYYAMMVARWL